MPYEVRLKPGHPIGNMGRGGYRFGIEPVTLQDDEMTAEIKAEPWLLVKHIKADKPDEDKTSGKARPAKVVAPSDEAPEEQSETGREFAVGKARGQAVSIADSDVNPAATADTVIKREA